MISLLLFMAIITRVICSYNPIPIGSLIISTTRTISILQPREYGGTDKQTIIFTAMKNMTIVNTIFDPNLRRLYVIYSNTTTNSLYISRLKSMEKLHSIRCRLPIDFNISSINKFTSFSSDIANKRAFLVDSIGTVMMFSTSGVMRTKLSIPSTINEPIRSVGYNENLDRLFIITDSTVNSCTKLDENNLECCQALPKTDRLRSIAFDQWKSNSIAYVLDEHTGIYEVILNPLGCPIALRPINAFDNYQHLYLVIHENLYACSGSSDHLDHHTVLTIANGTETPRNILFDASIVALHLSYSNRKSTVDSDETCFHGITYHDYRIAVILAAIFGTIMGVFMCFNALFCIDFFMTKRIIRDLKKQIPHNLFEDRWNKLVEEKYAKLALEKHRKKDDPQPKCPSLASAQSTSNKATNPSSTFNVTEGLPVFNPIPKISAYLRRKSESYLSRRRSDECRLPMKTSVIDFSLIPKKGIKEEDSTRLREKMSHDDLAKPRNELL